MTHFGLFCPTATGHLNTLLPLGCELQKRGHRVTVFQVADAEAAIRASGLAFYPLGTTTFPLGTMSQITDRLGELKGLAAVRHSIEWLRQTTQMILADAPQAIQATGVDLLIIDQIMVEGETLAEYVGLPFITVCSALPIHRDPTIPPFITNWHYSNTPWAYWRNAGGQALINRLTQPITQTIQAYRQQHNLPLYPQGHQPFSPLLQLCQEPAAFEYPRTTLPPWFHFTGPWHDRQSRPTIPFPFEQLSDLPLVYASMGTLQNRQQWIFEGIAQACASLPVQLVISLGNRQAQLPPNLPGNPLVVPYAPQIDLLQRASLTITHAGLNTTLESLRYGVPMVAIPITNDQPGVAARIAWNQAGLVVPPNRFSVPRLRTAIQQVLTESRYRQNAIRLQQAIHQSGGVPLAADLVEQVVESHQPVLTHLPRTVGSRSLSLR